MKRKVIQMFKDKDFIYGDIAIVCGVVSAVFFAIAGVLGLIA
jgi:hypothetical protein